MPAHGNLVGETFSSSGRLSELSVTSSGSDARRRGDVAQGDVTLCHPSHRIHLPRYP
jgi:hypothetical protein